MPRWPEIVITQKYGDAGGTFQPGFLVVPETSILFIGAVERLVGYNVERRERVFEDCTDYGFWGWTRQGDYILMAAELWMRCHFSKAKRMAKTRTPLVRIVERRGGRFHL